MKRLRAAFDRLALDAMAIAGWLLVAYGAGQAPAPWGTVLAPVVLGLGLLVTVGLGARAETTSRR